PLNTGRPAPLIHQADEAASIDKVGAAYPIIGGAVDALSSVAAIATVIARPTASPVVPDTRHIAVIVAVTVVDSRFVGEVSRLPVFVTEIVAARESACAANTNPRIRYKFGLGI